MPRTATSFVPTIPPTAYERVLERVAQGEKLLAVCAEPGLPSYASIRAHRKRSPDYDVRMSTAARRGRPRIAPEAVDRVVAALAGGSAIRSQAIVSPNTIRNIKARDSAFAIRITGLYRPWRPLTPAERARRQADRLQHVNTFAARESFLTALRSDEIYAVVERAVPRHLPPDMRDDVKSDLVVAILSGEVAPADAAAGSKRLVAAWNRMFMHRDQSLEADLGNGRTLGGMIQDPTAFSADGTGVRVLSPQW